MIYVVTALVCFGSSIIGTICGIGGGIIIKPVLDALGILDVPVLNFLSGCTVLSMTTYSVVATKIKGGSHIEKKTGFLLALGSVLGGLAGRELFSRMLSFYENEMKTGAFQAECLLIITLGTLIYTKNKSRIRTFKIKNGLACVIIGALLGLMSSFLGIGGGPINLVILSFFFSMQIKTAAENSLYIIFFSQASNLIYSMIMNNIPEFAWGMLILMTMGGLTGGIFGRMLNKKLEEKTVNNLFVFLLILIIFINIYNIHKFLT